MSVLGFITLFCGAGGDAIGLTEAGMTCIAGFNHDERATATHAANFPHAEHKVADLDHYDMRNLPRGARVLWASPICTEASPAGGNAAPRHRHLLGQTTIDGQDEPAPQSVYERTRATFYDVLRAVELWRFDAVLLENVVDVAYKWLLFETILTAFTLLGYNLQIVCVSSAHIGDEINLHAPQWRDRIYLVLTRIGIPLPDVAPRPLAWCERCGCDVAAVQWWKPTARRFLGQPVGKYREQYLYQCPQGDSHPFVEPYVRPAASVIDWSNLGKRIGDRKKPLVPATMARIRAGLELVREPALVTVNHGGTAAGPGEHRAVPVRGAPLPTRCVKIGEGIATHPLLVPAGGSWYRDAADAAAPFRPRLTTESEGLATPPAFIATLRQHGSSEPVSEPLATVTTSGHHHYLGTLPDEELDAAFYVKNYGGGAEPRNMAKPVTQPLGTITTSDHHALVIPYRRANKPTTTDQPLLTVGTRTSAALVQPQVRIEDCHWRMLTPREHLRAQRFPDSYIVTGNNTEQTAQAGNAVSSNVAHWLGRQVAAVLG
jgi:DNA (cytosine-5)-methyltransferase 1